MNDDLRNTVLERLESDYGLKRRTGTQYLRGGTCRSCNKKELFSRWDTPWMIRCGRESKCGKTWHVKELYEDLFDDWSRRAPATDQQPTASARAYLEFGRGFRLDLIEGCYSQENYWSSHHDAGSATIRFELEKGGYWERLIDRPQRFGKMKARFKPGESYRGTWWCPPGIDLLQSKEVWIVEGIFDAIALLHHGIDAVSAMSSNAFPETSLKELARQRGGKLPKLVWALDNEPGAHKYTRRWVRMARELGYTCDAAQVPQPDSRKLDWNDLHQRWAFIESDSERTERVAADLKAARHHGALLIAENASAKGLLLYEWHERHEFHFGFESRLYWFKMDFEKYTKGLQALEGSERHEDQLLSDKQRRDKALRQCGAVVEIANCYPQALYYQRNEVTDESWYYFRIDFPHDGASVKNTFTGGQMAAASEFKKRLLSMAAGAVFTGSGQQLDKILKDQLYGLKTITTIDYIGYSKEHSAYVFGDIAVCKGQVCETNSEDYFEFGKVRLKTLQKSIQHVIQRDPKSYRTDWLNMLWVCYGAQGLIALAFWLGSLFAEQIRGQHKSFPFLEVTGAAGAGKSTLIVFLWKLLGRDHEGFDPMKSTRSGRQRKMGQVANWPTVFIEGDRNEPDKLHARGFDWDELKDYYGGGTLGTRGMKTSGNETYEPPFRGTLVISQNAPVSASEAMMTRIVKMHFSAPKVTAEGRTSAMNLSAMEIDQVSHFSLIAMRQEARLLKTFTENTVVHEQRLRATTDLRVERIIKNHSQMMAAVDCLRHVCDVADEQVEAAHRQLIAMAGERQDSISADHPAVAEFWEVFDYLESLGDSPQVNHSTDAKLIAINLNEIAEKASEHRQQLADLKTLRAVLLNSRSRKLQVINKAVYSAVRAAQATLNPMSKKPTTVRCWIFQAPDYQEHNRAR